MEDDAYYGDIEYERAEQRAWEAQETDPLTELFDQDEPEVDTHGLSLFEALSLSVWDRQLARPDYYDWFLTEVTA